MKLQKDVMDWLDSRLGIRELLHKNLDGYSLPRNVNIWYTLGAVLLTMFGLQFLTGILLLNALYLVHQNLSHCFCLINLCVRLKRVRLSK